MGTLQVNLQAYKLYKYHLVHYLRPVDVALRLPDIVTPEQKMEISRLENAGNVRQATEKLLEIIERSDHLGKWPSFLNALKEYPRLIKILTSEPASEVEHQEYHVKWIHIFAPDLQEVVNAHEIVMHLKSEDVISEIDEQEILHKVDSSGNQAAFPLLLEALPRRQEPHVWFPAFLWSLLKSGHHELVYAIDPDFISAHKLGPIDMDEPSGSGASWNAGHSEEIEMVMEDSGEPDSSIGDLAAPLPSNPQHDATEYSPASCYHSNSLTEVKGDLLQNMNILDGKKIGDLEKDLTRDLQTESFELNLSTEDEAAGSHQSESENEFASDYESSDEEKPECKQKEHSSPLLNLRNYQLELAEYALRGNNTIICAETGSGKTWVALYIVKNHLESASPGKKLVVFMARTNPLIKQQHQRFVKYLPNYTTKLITGDSEHSTQLDIFLPDCDIICFTPQILFNNLEKQNVSLSDFSLMILDECHHTKKDEAYNRLMRKYLMAKVKNNVQILPQIVGMTASIGVGKSTSDDEAVDYIISVMANLDTCKLSTVEKYREEIEKYISRPKEDKIKMKDRPDDLCKKRILQAMIDVQEKLQDACLFEESLVDLVQSKRPRDLNSQQYTHWAKNVERTAASEVENPETSRLIISCVKYLATFNEALELNSLLGISDVCRFLARKFNPEKEQQSKHTPEERELFQIISKVQKNLGEYNKSEDQKNPNLEIMSKLLRDMLLDENQDQESRALVFVKARATCTSLADYLNNVLCNDNLRVHKLTGKAATPGDEGMTEAEQTDTLAKFASGEYAVLVSTSVGGEGIDIPDCNIVINYNYAGNEITKIQMTGRGRKKGGKNIVMGYEKTLDVDKLSTYKGAMMYRAMESIKKIDPRSLQRKVKLFQKEEISKQEFRDRVLEKQICMKKKGQFKLCCYKCSVEVIDGEDLRVLKGTYHVVIDKEFKTLIVTKPHKKPNQKKIEGLQKAEKIYCKKCGMDWGIYFIYNTLPLPTIKCESFKIRNTEDGKISTYKKWLNVPFVIEACELSEIVDLLEE
ncbi:hypothetical protein CHS0354_014161 [Potamilus streckersoni]|uniref:RNA helicase n=1 Tax=Potamilus streckersoni TaxID=2493646 RepID=A0AAE0VYF6_9BIVA|nr:hypothetical protein CHS0354_014161 [Potamilus streckersoni]